MLLKYFDALILYLKTKQHGLVQNKIIINCKITIIYRVIQKPGSIIWEMIISVIARKNL
jgi:hypothetical protein